MSTQLLTVFAAVMGLIAIGAMAGKKWDTFSVAMILCAFAVMAIGLRLLGGL